MISIMISLCIIFVIDIMFFCDYFKLKFKVYQLEHDIRCLEEDHGTFKGSEKDE